MKRVTLVMTVPDHEAIYAQKMSLTASKPGGILFYPETIDSIIIEDTLSVWGIRAFIDGEEQITMFDTSSEMRDAALKTLSAGGRVEYIMPNVKE